MDLLTADAALDGGPLSHPRSWYAETTRLPPARAPLGGDTRAHVCVVGAGYTGLSAARLLARAGADVVVIEARRVGSGASGRNGGQVGTGQRVDQIELERRLGREAADVLWGLAREAVARTRALAEAHAPDAGWRPGVASLARTQAALARGHRLAEHLARRHGHEAQELLDRDAARGLTGSSRFAGGVLDRDAGHLHPLRLAAGLARAAEEAGARLHEGTRALRVEDGRVVTADGAVTADHVILAGGGYGADLHPTVGARVMPINNFIVATEPLGPAMPLARDVAAADDAFVVSYWRRSEDGRLLFGGGESYGYRHPRDVARLVRGPLSRVYPGLADVRITHAWGGTLAITRSRMPHLSRPSPRVLTASGYSGHGVAMAVMAGEVLGHAILGRTARFDAMAAVPNAPFPGGGRARAPLLALGMTWHAMRDRLGW